MRFIFRTSYEQDIRLIRHGGQAFWYGALLLLLVAAPALVSDYWLAQLVLVAIYGIAGLGLMLLAGFTGLISLGQAAFLGVGAYVEAALSTRGWPLPLSLAGAVVLSAAAGLIVGLPALRVRGIYLAIATLAGGAIVEEILIRWEAVTGGNSGLSVPPLRFAGLPLDRPAGFYYLCLALAVGCTLAVLNLLRSPTGRAFVAIRDSEVSAQAMGIHLSRYKTLSFALSAGLSGLSGGLYAHQLRFLSPDQFTVVQSVELVMMVCIGGLGSLHGAFFGAAVLISLPQLIGLAAGHLPSGVGGAAGLQAAVFGVILIVFLLLEPRGLHGLWLKVRTYLELFPVYRRRMLKRTRAFQKSERLA